MSRLPRRPVVLFRRSGRRVSIGLPVDPVDNHARWASDIVSKLYGLLPADTAGDPLARAPPDNRTVRNVFVIGPDNRAKLVLSTR